MRLVSSIHRAARRAGAPLAATLAAALLGLHAAPAAAFERAQASAAGTAALEERSDRLIVRYRSAAAADMPSASVQLRARAAVQPFGAQMQHLRRLATGAHVFKLDRPQPYETLQQMARALQNGDADVEYAEPDLRMHPQSVPNDPKYPKQWALFEPVAGLNLPPAWERSTGAGVVVAVLDTGVRPHVDLVANLLPGYDFISTLKAANDGDRRDADAYDPGDWTNANQCGDGSLPDTSSWHGTHVAGTIAAVAHNGIGVTGVAYGAKLLPVRVLGRCGGYTSDIADGMVWAAGGSVSGVPANPTPARVINLSLGSRSRTCSTTYGQAIRAARARGAVVVVAAGNENMDVAKSTPANCAGVIAVTALKRNGARAAYANHGAAVDLAAPGGDAAAGILSTLNTGTTRPGQDSYGSYSGTSMATPHVAGVAALMLSVNPHLTPDWVETLLKRSVRPFPGACEGCGTGILDASLAVEAAIEDSVILHPTGAGRR